MRNTIISILLFTSTSLAFTTPALTDDPPARPAFALMDNTGDGSVVNFDLATIVPTSDTARDTLFRSSVLAQYVGPSGLGGYETISGSALFLNDPSGPRSSIGNLEFGGLLHFALSSHLDLGVRLGIVVPTASGDTLDHAVGTLLTHPADLATASRSSFAWARFGISPTYHRGPMFLRADFGLDTPFDGTAAEPLGHINLGAGFVYRSFSATAELQNLFASNTPEASGDTISPVAGTPGIVTPPVPHHYLTRISTGERRSGYLRLGAATPTHSY